MFTGIVEELGKIISISREKNGFKIEISCEKILSDLKIDDSVAVDGVCQTAVEVKSSSFVVQAIEDTINRTTFKDLKAGSNVNLERALTLETRLGGHLVQGHVDCVGKVIDKRGNGLSESYTILVPENYMKFIVPHGSITLNGVSLTIQQFSQSNFVVSIIPHTLNETTISSISIGSQLNVEFDIIGKYVDRVVNFKDKSLSFDRLKELGY